MIEIIENENRLIGSPQDIEALSKKESARILVLSDSHGNSEIFKNLVFHYGPGCDAIAFCGDGASDLAHLLEEAETSDELRSIIPPVIAYVQGNCDPSSYKILPQKSISNKMPAYQVLTAAGKNIYLCHGHNENVNFTLYPLTMRADAEYCKIALYGHTHLPYFTTETEHNVKILNPGSCNRPRGNYPPSFAILTITPSVIDAAFIQIDQPYSHTPAFKLFNPIF